MASHSPLGKGKKRLKPKNNSKGVRTCQVKTVLGPRAEGLQPVEEWDAVNGRRLKIHKMRRSWANFENGFAPEAATMGREVVGDDAAARGGAKTTSAVWGLADRPLIILFGGL